MFRDDEENYLPKTGVMSMSMSDDGVKCQVSTVAVAKAMKPKTSVCLPSAYPLFS